MNDELTKCRVCLQSEGDEKFVQLYEEAKRTALIISQISGVKMIDCPEYPALVCSNCINDVNTAGELRRKIIQADQHFRQKLSDFNEEKDISAPNEQISQSPSVKKRSADRKQFFCSKCFKSFSDSRYLEKHEYFRHTDIPVADLYVCDYCGHRTKTKQLVRNHIVTVHSTIPKDKFVCRVCGKLLSTKGNLDGHEKTHVDLDPSDYIKCTVCTKQFKSKRFMLEHRKLVHDKSKAVPCPRCTHVSTCKGAHNIHFKSIHLKLKDFLCPDCGLGFSTNSQLVRHFRIHSGERPYECSSCSKPFRLSTHKNRHEKICPKRTNK